VFPVRYDLNSYILFRRNSVFKGLKYFLLNVKNNTKAMIHLFELLTSCQYLMKFLISWQYLMNDWI
jgi:hypothetical protein